MVDGSRRDSARFPHPHPDQWASDPVARGHHGQRPGHRCQRPGPAPASSPPFLLARFFFTDIDIGIDSEISCLTTLNFDF